MGKKRSTDLKPSAWVLSYDRFEPAHEGTREALCTLGNGYLGTRGAAPESVASRIHYPGTYIAGVYNKVASYLAGRTIYNEDFVNCPNWLCVSFRIEKGDWVDPSKPLFYRQQLDMKNGELRRIIKVADNEGRWTTVETRRIVHMAEPHYVALKYIIIPENYDGLVIVRAGLDGTVQNLGVARYRDLTSLHLRKGLVGSFGRGGIYLLVETTQSKIQIAEASIVRIFSRGRHLRLPARVLTSEGKAIWQEFAIFAKRHQRYEIEKIVAIYTSKDCGVKDPLKRAIRAVKIPKRFDGLARSHRLTWAMLWKAFDIEIDGDFFSQLVLRFHTFHLLQTASIHNVNIDAGLPARGLHGEAYRGHIFWDKMFVMPFYDLKNPVISKALFMYRYRRLKQARKNASMSGYKGAMFPWQSGSTGEEETQIVHLNPLSGKWGPDYSRYQRHVSFAISYNVWQYWKRTGDFDFFVNYGAEMLLSIAQFGASLMRFDPKDKRYHTEGVMGPDEFHEKLPRQAKPGFRDNAYTNILIVWTLLRAIETLQLLPADKKKYLMHKLKLNKSEIELWSDITRRTNIIINNDGIISQFEGYFDLKELDWDYYRQRYGNIRRMDRILKAEGKSPNDYKVAKQADVLMIFYLFSFAEVKDIFERLGYSIGKDIIRKNYDYYIKRTSHGSTLSRVVHCYLAHMLGRTKEAWDWFIEVLKSDIYDTREGTTHEGIHVGVMGGSIDIVIRRFAGINFVDNSIFIDPNLPRHWRRLNLRLLYRNNRITFSISRDHISIYIDGPRLKEAPFDFEIRGKVYHLEYEKTHHIPFK